MRRFVAAIRMTSEEFWQKSRKAYKKRQKEKKQSFASKEEYVNSDFYRAKIAKRELAEKWQSIDKNKFSWSTPTISIDLSYSVCMTDKVFRLFFVIFSALVSS
jgi:hypothetical protein